MSIFRSKCSINPNSYPISKVTRILLLRAQIHPLEIQTSKTLKQVKKISKKYRPHLRTKQYKIFKTSKQTHSKTKKWKVIHLANLFLVRTKVIIKFKYTTYLHWRTCSNSWMILQLKLPSNTTLMMCISLLRELNCRLSNLLFSKFTQSKIPICRYSLEIMSKGVSLCAFKNRTFWMISNSFYTIIAQLENSIV